jgi:hypothetical protein
VGDSFKSFVSSVPSRGSKEYCFISSSFLLFFLFLLFLSFL